MTSGGTVVRLAAQPPAPAPRATRRWIDDPRLVHHLPTVLAAVVFLGCYWRIRQRWFIPGFSGNGYPEWVVRSTVEGTAIAPNQYRPLMPWVDHLLALATGVPLPTAIVATDGLLLVVAVALAHHLAVRLGHPALLLAAAAGWALWVVKLDHWHPEIMLLTVIVTAACLLLLDPAPRALPLVALGLIACAARTDYAAGLGLIVLGVGAHRRRTGLAAAGFLIGCAAVASTILLVELYPQARYQIAVVQLPFNLTAGSWAFVATFYLPLLLAPLLLALRRRALPPLAPAVAWFAVQFAATFVVGVVSESRIFMPLAPALGIAAAAAWRELRRDVTAEHTAT